MNKKTFLYIAVFLIATVFFSSFQSQQDYKVLFEKAKYTMETKGDLYEAIHLFERIIKEFPNEREYAAKAQLQIGACYERLGKQQATEAYNKVVSQYSDQQQTAKIARKRLQYLNTLVQRTKEVGESRKENQVIAKIIYPNPQMSGDITPDGKYLSDVDWTMGNMRINNIETGKKELITDEGSWKIPNKFGDHSVWSHDGKFLAYFWIIGDGAQLRIHNFDTGEYRILAQSDKMNDCPWPDEWTRDGKYILASGHDKEQNSGAIQLVSVDDGSVKTIKTIDECPCGGVAISPDGKYVAVTIGDKAVDRDIHIVAVDGSLDYTLIDFPGADWSPKWTPDGGKVIFASHRSGQPALWSIKMKDGLKVAEPELIYGNISDTHSSMRFTDDGKYIFSSSFVYSNIFIATINPDEGVIESPTQITGDRPGIYSAPFWSPDESKIAYFERNPANNHSSGVLIYDLKKRTEKELELGLNNLERRGSTSPQWSENNKELLLSYVKKNRTHEMVLVNTETENKEYLRGGAWKVYGPGNSIIYIDSTNNYIFQKNISNGNEKLLFKSDRHIYNMVISKDKTTLAFFIWDDEVEGTQNELFILPVQGSKAKMLWKPPKNQYFGRFGKLNFFPDNETLLLSVSTKDVEKSNIISRQLYTININTLEKRPLGEELTDPDVIFNYIRLSPEGKKIAFCKGQSSFNIWSLECEF